MGIVLALILSIIVAIVTSSEFLTGLTFVVAVTFICLYLQYGLIIRRCHDLKQDSWLHSFIEKDDTSAAKFLIATTIVSNVFTVLEIDTVNILISIPLLIVSIYLTFAPGEIGTNEYGEDPLIYKH